MLDGVVDGGGRDPKLGSRRVSFALLPSTAEIASATELEWRRQLRSVAGQLPEGKFMGALDWAKRFAEGKADEHTYSFALVKEGGSHATALVELTHALAGQPDAWLKMLRVIVEPSLDLSGQVTPIETVQELARVAAFILLHGLGLAVKELPARELKVWGITPLTPVFLDTIASALAEGEALKGVLSVEVKGNWLVLGFNGP